MKQKTNNIQDSESCYEINKTLSDIYLDNHKRWDNDSVSKLLGFMLSNIAFIMRSNLPNTELKEFCKSLLTEIKELKSIIIVDNIKELKEDDMSGGFFNYDNYRINDIIDQVQDLIESKVWNNEYHNIKDTNGFKNMLNVLLWHLKVSSVMTQRLDWFLSGDDGEESFWQKLQPELDSLFNNSQWLKDTMSDLSDNIDNTNNTSKEDIQ